MKKQELLDILERLPDEIDPEQIMRELYLKVKLDRAEAAVAKGQVVSQEEVVQRSREWFT
jgi:hypothetical protein